MGVLGGRDNFSSKWITAMIVDAQNRLWLVPIKNTLDDYFSARINKEEYVFKIDHSRILMWYTTLTKSFRVLWYTTAHYSPVSPYHTKLLENTIKDNNLPKMNRLQHTILSNLAKREKAKFKPHDLNSLIKEINKNPEKNTENLRNIKTYLQELDTKQIITPLKEMTDFIQDDLITTDPKFVESVPEAIIKAEEENRKVTNSPIGAKRSWMKIMALLMAVGVVIGLIAFLASTGGFDSLGGSFGNLIPQPNKPTQASLVQQYPTPESMKIAIDNGQLDYKTLPAEMKKLIDNFKPQPIVKPKSQTVELTP